MSFTYVGDIPRNLESGRPIFNGDVLDEVSPEDALALSRWLVQTPTAVVTPPAPTEPEPTPPTDEVT